MVQHREGEPPSEPIYHGSDRASPSPGVIDVSSIGVPSLPFLVRDLSNRFADVAKWIEDGGQVTITRRFLSFDKRQSSLPRRQAWRPNREALSQDSSRLDRQRRHDNSSWPILP